MRINIGMSLSNTGIYFWGFLMNYWEKKQEQIKNISGSKMKKI